MSESVKFSKEEFEKQKQELLDLLDDAIDLTACLQVPGLQDPVTMRNHREDEMYVKELLLKIMDALDWECDDLRKKEEPRHSPREYFWRFTHK